MTDGMDEARQAIAGIPLLADAGEPRRLGGLTNLVFRVGDYCLRIPGKGTEEYIDRDADQQAAEEEGVGARFLVQGTLYPDVIESGHGHSGAAANIKTHHNLPIIKKFR